MNSRFLLQFLFALPRAFARVETFAFSTRLVRITESLRRESNPLLGSPTYQPLTGGMQAALPHVDVFAPVHDLASLEALARHLHL
ncbi:MAG: hypothetical protein JWM41_4408 [Gemmatimonadetes bacterium]|nr:hypothetical protein [Gemmatimonadota bacterium]